MMLTFSKLGFYVIFFCSLLSIDIKVLGQVTKSNITFSNWQKKDGLPSNNVLAVEKDKLGFLWIATNDGLCRYDGPNLIKVYRRAEDGKAESNSLKSNNIRSLLCDSEGYLWIGTRFGGVTRLNPLTNEWKTFQHDASQASSLSNDEVLTVFEDSKKRIWIGTEKGLNLFNQSTSTFTRYKLNDTENDATSKSILTIMEDQQGWIWVGTWSGGLYLMLTDGQGNFGQQETRHFETTTNKASNNVWSLLQDNEGRYWIGTHGGGLLLMNLPENASNKIGNRNWEPTFHKYVGESENAKNLKSNAIQSIIQDKFNNLWVGTTHGLYIVDSKNLPPLYSSKQTALPFQRYLQSPNSIESIVGNNIMDLFEDDQGLIWIATSEGLSQYNWESNQFRNYNYEETELTSPFAPNFIVDKDKNIWVGHGKPGMRKYRIVKNQLIKVDTYIDKSILGEEIMALHSPDGKNLLVGTELGITKIDLKTLKPEEYPIPDWMKSKFEGSVTTTILEDKDGFIWVGTKLGLFKINPKTKGYTVFEPDPNDSTTISDWSINHILQDVKGAIWIATYRGLNRIADPSSKKIVFEQFLFNADRPENGPKNNRIMCLREIDDYLYVGTNSGICRYNQTTSLFEFFNDENHKYWIRSIEEGLNNNIWVSTNEGLFHFDAGKKSFRSFDKKDGLINPAYVIGSSWQEDNGNIYFAYDKGFTFFSPKDLVSNKVAPPVYITEIEKMNRDGIILEDGIHKKQIILNHDDYRLSINYAALNYNRADKNQYAYRLIGFEEQWNKAKLGTPIVYTNLEPKEYRLEVKAANNDGVWNEVGRFIKIIQRPAYWETWWFRLLCLSLLAATVFLIISWYTNKIRKHNEELQDYNKSLNEEIANRKKVEQQLNDYNNELKRSNKDLEQFAYASSHDLKEPLRVIANFTGLLSNGYKDQLDNEALKCIEFIEDGVQRMANVIDSLLTYSTVGRKDSVYNSIDLDKLLKNKLLDLSQLIKDRNAFVEVQDLPEIIGEREQIGMVFFNLINNAIKFNTADQPRVIVREEMGDKDFWKFSVSDNGIGIESEHKDKVFGIFKRLHNRQKYDGTGIGLSVCQKIVSRHKGSIWFDSELGEGTTFYFTIKKNLFESGGAEMSDHFEDNRKEENKAVAI